MNLQQNLLVAQQDVDLFKKKNAQVIEARQRQIAQIQKAQSIKSAQTEQIYVPNIQQVIEYDPERSANYVSDGYTFNDGVKDTKSAVMGGLAQAGDGIVTTLGTVGGGYNALIDEVMHGDNADADRSIAESVRSLRRFTAGANAYWRDKASEHTKNELAQYNALKNQAFDSDWDRAVAQAEFLATHPKLSTYLAGESLVNSAVTLGLAGGIGGANRASQMVGTGVLAGGAYVAQADDEDRVTGDTVGHALAVAGISSLLNLPNGSLEGALVRGFSRSGTDTVKKGMLSRVPAIVKNPLVEAGTEFGDSVVEKGAENLEKGLNIADHVLSHGVEGAMLGAYASGMHTASSDAINTVKSGNDVVTSKLRQYTNPYKPDIMMDVEHKKYNPTRVLQEEVKAIDEAEDEATVNQAKSRITAIDTQLRQTDAIKQQEIENATDDATKSQLQAAYETWYQTYYQPYLETMQAIENASSQTGKNNPIQSILASIRQIYNNPTVTNNTQTATNQSQQVSGKPNRTGFNPNHPVAIMGDYAKGDTGSGSGDHYDVRLGKVNGKRSDVTPYLNRLQVMGKNLTEYAPTSRYGDTAGRDAPHQGVDFGINGSFNKNAEARKMYVAKEWVDKVVSIQAKSQAKSKNGKSAGNYTEITFSDGVVLQVLHQNATGTQEVMSGHTFNSTINQQTTQKGFNYNPNHGHSAFDESKANSILRVARNLGINPNDLASVISFETAGSMSPSQHNLAGGSALGLIQFMPDTAKGLGTSRDALAKMSFDEQMNYVEKYLKQRGIKAGATVADLYDAVTGVQSKEYKAGSAEYEQNKIWDVNNDGIITKGEAVGGKGFKQHQHQYFTEGFHSNTTTNINTELNQLRQDPKPSPETLARIDELEKQVTELQNQPSETSEQTTETEQTQATQTEPVVHQDTTAMLGNSPLISTVARASMYSVNQIEQLINESTDENEKAILRTLLESKRGRSAEVVSNIFANGQKGANKRESDLGIADYVFILNNAIQSNNQPVIDEYMGYLANFNQSHQSKANLVKQYNDRVNNGRNYHIVRDEGSLEWRVVDGVADRNTQSETGAFDILPKGNNAVADAKYQEIFAEANAINNLFNEYTNILSQRQSSNVTGTTTPAIIPIGQANFDGDVTNVKPTGKRAYTGDIQGTNVSTVGYSKIKDYQRKGNEVWVGNKFNYIVGEHKIDPNSSLSTFTKGQELADGTPATGRIFDGDKFIYQVGSLGNPYSTENGTREQHAWGADNPQDAIKRYTDLVKHYATSEANGRVTFLEDLMQLRGKKLVTDEYHANEAKFLDYLVNQMPVEYANAIAQISQQRRDGDISSKQVKENYAKAREWIENIEVSFDDETVTSYINRKTGKEHKAVYQNIKLSQKPQTKEERYERMGIVGKNAKRTHPKIGNQSKNTDDENVSVELLTDSNFALNNNNQDNDTGLINNRKKKVIVKASEGIASKKSRNALSDPKASMPTVKLADIVSMDKPNDIHQVLSDLIDALGLDKTASDVVYKKALILQLAQYTDNPKLQFSHKNKDNHFDLDSNVIHLGLDGDVLSNLAQILLKQSLVDVSGEIDGVTKSDIKYAKHLLSINNPHTSENTVKRLQRLYDAGIKLSFAQSQIFKYKKQNATEFNKLDDETKQTINFLLNSKGDLLSVGLSDDKVRAFLQNVRYKVTGKQKRSNLYEYLKDVVRGFFGFGVDETNVLDTLLSAMGDIAEVKLLESDFVTDEDAKLSVFNVERKAHLAFDYGDINRNEFVVAFTQGKNTALSKVKDLVNKIAKDPNKAVTFLLKKQMTEQQQKQLDDFLDFRKEFTQYIKEAFITDKFSHRDLKNYLMNADGIIDDNVLDALTAATYDFVITKGNNSINTFDDVGFILGVDADDNPIIPTKIYTQYKYIGNPLPVVAQEMGSKVVALLDLKETDEAKQGSAKDLGVSLGGLLISSMQIAGLVNTTTMKAEQHIKNMEVVGGKLQDYAQDLNSQTEIRFVNFTDNGTKDKNERIDEVLEASKGTQGFLAELFGVEFGLRPPKLKAPKEVKRTVKGTKSLVSDLQATLIKKMQSEPIEIDVSMFTAFDRLYTSHNDKFMQMLGARVTDEQLAKMHVNDRDSAEASAEGLSREVDNMLDFMSGLSRNAKGKFQEFWDSIYVAKNDRMHFNSNMFNMQTSLIHRMMASYKNFRTTIDMKGITLDNLVEHALKVDKPTKLGLYLKALGMNLEGTERFVAKFVEGENTDKADYKFLGHTADKIDGATFIPAFVAWIKTNEVQQAITAMQKVLDGKEVTNSDFDAINTFVKAGDMGVQSMRALVELTNMTKAMNTGTQLSTAIGLGSDGINNGIALGYIYNAVATMTSMVQTGFIPVKNKWNVKSFFEATHFKDVGDYYIGFSNEFNNQMELVKANPEVSDVLSAVETLQPSLYTRKFAKAIVIPFGYGAGIKRLIQLASETFTKDIQRGLTSLAENPTEESIVAFEQRLQTLLGDREFRLPRTSAELLEFWFTSKQLNVLIGVYADLVGGTIKSALDTYAGEFAQVRNRNTAMHQVTFNIFYSTYEVLVNKAVAKVMAEQGLSAQEFANRGFTNKEWREFVEKPLVFMMPRVATAYGATQDDIIIDESIDKIDDALTAIEVLKRGTKFVTKRQASKTNMKNSKGELQGITINLPSKQKTFEEVGVFVNSAQIQGTDSRISASASAMFGLEGIVNLNIHDQNDSGLDTYLQMVLTQNKTTYTTLAQTHIQLNSLTALVDTLVYLQKNVNRGNITKKFYQEQLELLVIGIDMLSLQADNVMSGLIQAVKSMEHNKLVTLENVYAVQQYAGETGEYVITKKDLELVDKQRKIIDDRIATLEKELTQLQLPQKVIPTKSMKEITNHSGGAKGADTVWDNYGKSVGMVNNNHYYYQDDNGNPPNANTHISEHDFKVGKIAGARAGKRNFGFEYRSVSSKLIARNFAQVKYADMVVAVANIVAEGEPIMPNIQGDGRVAIAPSVTGGTGYAVGMAILMDKPVYVYNQTGTDSYKQGWYMYDKTKDDFTPTDVPVLSKNFAGIGTRNLTQAGVNAIADVYKKTYQELTGNEFTGEFKTNEQVAKEPNAHRAVNVKLNDGQQGQRYTNLNLKDFINTHLAKVKTNNSQRELMDWLFKKLGADVSVEIVSANTMNYIFRDDPPPTTPNGAYKDGKIYLLDTHVTSGNSFAIVATALHELLHMATENSINNPATDSQKLALAELQRMYQFLKAKDRASNVTDLTAKLNTIFESVNYVGELIAYTLTDPDVRVWVTQNLADYKVKNKIGLTNPTNLLRKFLAVLTDFFGLKKGDNLETFVRLVDKLSAHISTDTKSSAVASLHEANETEIIVNDETTVDVLKLLPSNASESHNKHLDNLIDNTIGKFYAHNKTNKQKVDRAVTKLPTDNLVKQFNLDTKEAHTFAVLREVFHEYMLSQKGTWASNDLLKIYNELKAQLTYENFLTNNNPSELEIKLAKQAYTAIFSAKLSQDYLAKFIALALVSEKFNGVLDINRKRIKRKLERPLFDRLMRVFDDIVNFFTGLFINKGGKVNQQLQHLNERLVKLDIQARNERVDMLDKSWSLIGTVGAGTNRFAKKALVSATSKLNPNSQFTAVRLLANYSQLSKGKSTDEVLKDVNDAVQTFGYQGKVPKEFRQLLIELGSNKGIQRIMESMVRFTNKVGQDRQRIRDRTRSALLSQFSDNGKNLTKEERHALTAVVMRADVGSLLHSMNITSAFTLLTQEDKRQAKISSLEQSIMGHAFGNDMLKQAKRLSAYMSHGITTSHMVKNTTLIAMGMGHDYQVDINQVNQDLVKQLDVLVSLYAVENLSTKEKELFNALVANEKNGVALTIKLQQQLGDKSKEEFKDNPYNYQKGYVPEMTDPNRSLIWIEPSTVNPTTGEVVDHVAKYEKHGWELVSELEQSPYDTSDKRVLMVHYDVAHMAKRQSGAMDMSDTQAKGSVLASVQTPEKLSRIAKAMHKDRVNDSLSYRDFDPFEQDTGLIINFNADGSIKDFHYEMQGFVRDEYLQRNNDMFELMPMLNAQIAFRTDIKDTQRKLAQVLYDDYQKNYLKNPKLFVTMTPESTDKRVREDFALMPYAFRKEAMALFGKDQPIVVRASVYNTVFGFREYSIAQMFDKISDDKNILEKLLTSFMNGATVGNGKTTAVNIERLVRYIVGQAKDMIVIRSGKVLVGNIIANLLLLMLHGVRPDVIVKDMIFAWREGTRYTKAQNRVLEIKTLLITAKGKEKSDLTHERNQLKIEIKQSPMARYMDAGMMSTIVEDTMVLKDQQNYPSKYEQRINKFVDKIPNAIKTPIDWLIINPNTPVYQFLADATQFSDFGAKYVLAKHLTEKQGIPFDRAISIAQDNFINFDVPHGVGMDYMNKIGLFMFTKFFVRFQKVMTKMLYEKPAQTIAQHVGVEAFTDMAGVLDPFMLFRVGNNPFEASAFSIIGASDDILTFQVLTGSW